MKIMRVDALTVKFGPTQSGNQATSPSPEPVGGEVFPVFGGEIASLVVVALVLVFGFILVRKSGLLSSLLTRLRL